MSVLELGLVITSSVLLGIWVVTALVIFFERKEKKLLLFEISQAKNMVASAQALLDKERAALLDLKDKVNALASSAGMTLR